MTLSIENKTTAKRDVLYGLNSFETSMNKYNIVGIKFQEV